jgi:ankyrin repeat protein
VNSIRPDNGYSPLHMASFSGYIEMVQELITAGAEVNMQAKGAETPIAFAVRSSHFDAALVLLGAGADLRYGKEQIINSAKYYSAGNKAAAELLAKLNVNIDPNVGKSLFDAIKKKDLAKLKEAVAKGVDVNEKSDDGDIALHMAIELGFKEAVDSLIKAGAKLNETGGSQRETPIQIAIRTKQYDVAKTLKAAGASLD